MDPFFMTVGIGAGISLYLTYLLTKSRFEVRQGYLAVMTEFGKAKCKKTGDRHLQTFSPGFHFKWPWQKIQEISMMEQMIELSGENAGTVAMASDGTMLRFDSKLRFSHVEKDLYNFLFSMENPMEHIKRLFTCLLRNEIANFGHMDFEENETDHQKVACLPQSKLSSYAAIQQGRRSLNKKIHDFCRTVLNEGYGIQFDGVDLTDILPPNELASALNAVINAKSEAYKQYTQMECECEQRLLSAKKSIAIAQAKAKAVEEEVATICDILLEVQSKGMLQHYIDRRRAEVYSESRTSFIKRST